MTIATSLAQAAGLTFDNLQVKWAIGQLKVRMTNFWSQVIDLFPESEVNSHPVSNWLTVVASLSDQLPLGVTPLTDLDNSAQAIYRTCWMGSALQTQGLITTAQANALLGSYNGNFG